MSSELPTVTAHRLPCTVSYSGRAPTAGAFFRYTPVERAEAQAGGVQRAAGTNDGSGEAAARSRGRRWRSTFRGRELQGATVFFAPAAADAAADDNRRRDEPGQTGEHARLGDDTDCYSEMRAVLLRRCRDEQQRQKKHEEDEDDGGYEWRTLARVSHAIYYNHDEPPLLDADSVPLAFEAACVAQALAERVQPDEAQRALEQVLEWESAAPAESIGGGGGGGTTTGRRVPASASP